MATKDKLSTASAALPSNEAIWSGRKVAVPKAPKVKRAPKTQTPQRASKRGRK
jgi:hypothetical protein